MGHEMTGRIAALGAGVSTDSTGKALAEGDRIIYNYFFPCGRCAACLRDQPEACPKKMRPGFKGRFGEPGVFPYFIAGFSEYYYLPPGHICVKVPDDLSDAVVAPINCALAQVIQGLVSSGAVQPVTVTLLVSLSTEFSPGLASPLMVTTPVSVIVPSLAMLPSL